MEHKPVMVKEVIEFLNLKPSDTIIDGTIGEGGHAVAIGREIAPGGFLIGVDKDANNLEKSRKRIESLNIKFTLFCDSYANIRNLVKKTGRSCVDGVFLDLGFSMGHIKSSGRGFSFNRDEVLDMRYDNLGGVPAHKWLNNVDEKEIAVVLKDFGQEKDSRKIAAAICKYRTQKYIKTTRQLAEIISKVKHNYRKKIHPATKVFQAIRIYINDELGGLRIGLAECLKVIKENGRLAVLTYHSLEDKIVKDNFRYFSGECLCRKDFPLCCCGALKRRPRIRALKKVPLSPGDGEVKKNPSARSAHLRVCEITKSWGVKSLKKTTEATGRKMTNVKAQMPNK